MDDLTFVAKLSIITHAIGSGIVHRILEILVRGCQSEAERFIWLLGGPMPKIVLLM
jgi:hypothetical protein